MSPDKNETETPATDRLVICWDEMCAETFWSDLSDRDLYAMEGILWGMHKDAVMEWSRRQMRKTNPHA